MSTILKFTGYITIVFAFITAISVFNIELLEMKWAYAGGIILSGLLFGITAVLIARIYDGTVADDHDNSDYARKRASEDARSLY
jgi:hypothetical protein